jgi:hypothetical protein
MTGTRVDVPTETTVRPTPSTGQPEQSSAPPGTRSTFDGPTSDLGDDPAIGAPGVALELYWIPLGAGSRTVQFSGRAFESLAARRGHRTPCDLYHSALVATLGDDRYFIEMTPVPPPARAVADRGVVGGGAVGTRWAAPLRIFRYEIRCWRNGLIPDLQYAVDRPVHLTCREPLVRAVVDSVPSVPTPTWGRDELRTGEMWNSNSVVAWILAVTGLAAGAGEPPARGRAPGWYAGITLAERRKEHREPGTGHSRVDRR